MSSEQRSNGRDGGRAERVLVCSERPEICRTLIAEFERLSDPPAFVACRRDWEGANPTLALIDLGSPDLDVAAARREFRPTAEIWALVDDASGAPVIPAIASGCSDYLFYPVNPSELRLRWRRHREAGQGRPAGGGARVTGALEIGFPSEVRFLGPAVDRVVEACETISAPGSGSSLDLRVAVGEAVANAILHGNREDPDKQVRIRADFGDGRVRVTVSDEGRGFDPEAVADPTLPENRNRSHGRGLFLLRSLMDEVRYNDAGNRVTLVLRPSG